MTPLEQLQQLLMVQMVHVLAVEAATAIGEVFVSQDDPEGQYGVLLVAFDRNLGFTVADAVPEAWSEGHNHSLEVLRKLVKMIEDQAAEEGE